MRRDSNQRDEGEGEGKAKIFLSKDRRAHLSREIASWRKEEKEEEEKNFSFVQNRTDLFLASADCTSAAAAAEHKAAVSGLKFDWFSTLTNTVKRRRFVSSTTTNAQLSQLPRLLSAKGQQTEREQDRTHSDMFCMCYRRSVCVCVGSMSRQQWRQH